MLLHCLFLGVGLHGMLILLSDPVHDVGYPILNLFLDTLDAFFLFVGQVKACVQRVGTTAVDFNELLIFEKPLFGDKAGTGGKVLFGSFVISGSVLVSLDGQRNTTA